MSKTDRFLKQEFRQQRETHPQPIVPLSSDIARYDLLSISTKGIFPDIIPDREKLKEITDKVGKSELAVPVRWANPAERPSAERAWWRGLYEKDPSVLDYKITEDEWKKRKEAVIYSSLVAVTDYERMRFLHSTAESLRAVSEELAKEINSAKERGENVAKKKQELMEKYHNLVKSYDAVIRFRDSLINQVAEELKGIEEEYYANLSDSYKDLVKTLESATRKSDATPGELKAMEETIVYFEEKMNQASIILGKIFSSKGIELVTRNRSNLPPELIEGMRQVAGESGVEKLRRIWKVYQPLAESPVSNPLIIEKLYYNAFKSAVAWDTAEKLQRKLKDLYTREAVRLKDEAIKLGIVPDGKFPTDYTKLSLSEIKENTEKIIKALEKELNATKTKLSLLSSDYKTFKENGEERKAEKTLEEIQALSERIWKIKSLLYDSGYQVRLYGSLHESINEKIENFKKNPLIFPLTNGKTLEEEEEKIKEYCKTLAKEDVEITAQTHPELFDFLSRVEMLKDPIGQAVSRNMRGTDKINSNLVQNAIILRNLDEILARAKKGNLDFKNTDAFAEKIALFLGTDKDSDVVKNLMTVIENEIRQKDAEREELPAPLTTMERIQIARTLKTFDLIRDVSREYKPQLQKAADVLLRSSYEEMQKGRTLRSKLLGGIAGACVHLSSLIQPEKARFGICLDQVAYPSDTYPNIQPSARMRECIEKFKSDLEKKRTKWDKEFSRIASLNPVNPWLYPYHLIAMWKAITSDVEKSIFERKMDVMQKRIASDIEKVIFSENPDEELRKMSHDIYGVTFEVKPPSQVPPYADEVTAPAVEAEETLKKIEERLRTKNFFARRYSFSPEGLEEFRKELAEARESLSEFSEVYRKYLGHFDDRNVGEAVESSIEKLRSHEEFISSLKKRIEEVLNDDNLTDREKNEKLKEIYDASAVQLAETKKDAGTIIGGTLNLLKDFVEDLKENPEANSYVFTIKGEEKGDTLLIYFKPETLKKEFGEEFLQNLKKPEKRRELLSSVFREYGIDEKQIAKMLDKGEIRNGMEYNQVFSTVTRSLAIRVARERELQKKALEREKSSGVGIEL